MTLSQDERAALDAARREVEEAKSSLRRARRARDRRAAQETLANARNERDRLVRDALQGRWDQPGAVEDVARAAGLDPGPVAYAGPDFPTRTFCVARLGDEDLAQARGFMVPWRCFVTIYADTPEAAAEDARHWMAGLDLPDPSRILSAYGGLASGGGAEEESEEAQPTRLDQFTVLSIDEVPYIAPWE